jgi:hypothetical protein
LNEGVSNPNEDRPPAYERPAYEPAPSLPNEEGGPLVRPKAIDTAFQASLAATAIGAVSAVFMFLLDRQFLDDIAREAVRSAGTGAGALTQEQAVNIYRISMVIGIGVFVGLNLLFTFKMRAGRNWARIVLTVFAVIGALSFLSAMTSSGAELELMWSLAQTAFGVTAVIYMFRKESNAYFLAYKQRRMRR